jgi:hypothetical protein
LSVTESARPNALAVALVMVIGVPGGRWNASEDRQLETYGDLRTTMMWDIGWRLREGDGSVARILLVGPPWVYAKGFPNLTVLAPEVAQEDIPGQFLAGVGAPELPSDAIMILVPERSGERCAIETAYPDATVMQATTRDGTPLYIAFSRGTSGGVPLGETPAETSLAVVTSSPCTTSQ